MIRDGKNQYYSLLRSQGPAKARQRVTILWESSCIADATTDGNEVAALSRIFL